MHLLGLKSSLGGDVFREVILFGGIKDFLGWLLQDLFFDLVGFFSYQMVLELTLKCNCFGEEISLSLGFML